MAVESVGQSLLGHLGAWSEEDWFALGETPDRIELVDGVLVVSPAGSWRHQLVTGALAVALRERSADGRWQVVEAINVRLWRDHIRIPDVVVFTPGPDEQTASASEVLLVVEVTSPRNFRQDRVVKHGEYAEAGIPFFVRVDLHLGVEALTATAFELVDGEYAVLAHAADGVLRLERPWPVEIDLRAAARG